LNESIYDPDTFALAKPSNDTSSIALNNKQNDNMSYKSLDDNLSYETGNHKVVKKPVIQRRGKRRE